MMSLTTSPIEITPTTLPASSTGRWRKRRSHHCHAAFQLVVRLDRHRVARHHLAHRSLLRIEPGQQHFYGAVTLGHDTDQYVVVDDQHRPDPVVAHLAQGFDDHVAGTNMDQGATLLGQSVFDCAHRVPLVGPVLARPNVYYTGCSSGNRSDRFWPEGDVCLRRRSELRTRFAQAEPFSFWPEAAIGHRMRGRFTHLSTWAEIVRAVPQMF